MTNLASYAEDVRNLILLLENSLSEFDKMKAGTKSEALLRRKIINYLESSEAFLIDCHAMLLDAMLCRSDEDLEQVVAESEVET